MILLINRPLDRRSGFDQYEGPFEFFTAVQPYPNGPWRQPGRRVCAGPSCCSRVTSGTGNRRIRDHNGGGQHTDGKPTPEYRRENARQRHHLHGRFTQSARVARQSKQGPEINSAPARSGVGEAE